MQMPETAAMSVVMSRTAATPIVRSRCLAADAVVAARCQAHDSAIEAGAPPTALAAGRVVALAVATQLPPGTAIAALAVRTLANAITVTTDFAGGAGVVARTAVVRISVRVDAGAAAVPPPASINAAALAGGAVATGGAGIAAAAAVLLGGQVGAYLAGRRAQVGTALLLLIAAGRAFWS